MRFDLFCALMGALVISVGAGAFYGLAALGLEPWEAGVLAFLAFISVMTFITGVVRQAWLRRNPNLEHGFMAAVIFPTLSMAEAIPGVYGRMMEASKGWETTSMNFGSMFFYLLTFFILAATTPWYIAITGSALVLGIQVAIAHKMNADPT